MARGKLELADPDSKPHNAHADRGILHTVSNEGHTASARRQAGKGSGRFGSAPGPGARCSGSKQASSRAFSAGQSMPVPIKTNSCRRSPQGSAQCCAM